MTTTLGLEHFGGRCSRGFHANQHPAHCDCLTEDPWPFFVRTLRANVRPDGTVHVNDVRELFRGRIAAKQIGLLWRRARTLDLIREAGWEPSTDSTGGNADKQSRYYAATDDLRSAAA